MATVCNTKFIESAIDDDPANFLYNLLETVKWSDGIKSKNGFTRKAYPVSVYDPIMVELLPYIEASISKLTTVKYDIHGVYLNYYENGEMYTPNHSHKGTHQLVISLGGTRTLKVGSKNYSMGHGDIILFGSAVHGVPKENTTEPRI